MKILALEKESPANPSVESPALLRQEAWRVWELVKAGVIREAYFRGDRRLAVLVLECANVDAARQALDSLPLVKELLIDFELIPLAPYDGFSRLFAIQP